MNRRRNVDAEMSSKRFRKKIYHNNYDDYAENDSTEFINEQYDFINHQPIFDYHNKFLRKHTFHTQINFNGHNEIRK